MTAPRRAIPAGTFVQGDDHAYPEEAPSREVRVDDFEIDVHPVTNAQFAAFVSSTGHITTAERSGSAVFVPADAPVDLGRPDAWWRHDAGATWRRPREVALDGEHDDHPVVAISRDDAAAYAAWAGGRLPTEAEWEWAAGAGEQLGVDWPLAGDGMLLANVWLGEFPWRSIRTRPPGTMPVGSFPPNPFGLFDMLGNVWELTADAWSTDHHPASCCGGPATSPAAVVAKGGSFLCAANYCRRYRPAARHRQGIDEAACHVGFRCAYPLGTGALDG
ncbi:MAG: gliding motility-associated lipoprotein GldK [Ilumatobacteraceae bacterium]|nr:gliding motility-associated lipoprotein GldK [Ilumatobacteraceae bacterium]